MLKNSKIAVHPWNLIDNSDILGWRIPDDISFLLLMLFRMLVWLSLLHCVDISEDDLLAREFLMFDIILILCSGSISCA